jgi:uncharacterized protein (TIGR04255 family)
MNTALGAVSMDVGDKYPHLPRAPIIEAVIDWRVKLAPVFDVTKLKEVGAAFGSEYQLADEEKQFQFGIKQKAGAEAELTSRQLGIHGYRFRSADGLQVVILSPDGFSFSRLKPYTRWELVFSEACRLWDIYRKACEPEEISRIAVRYINRIAFPLPVKDFAQYLTVPPAVPPGAPPVLAALLFKAVLHDPPSGISANVTQVIEPPEDGMLPFILDIDAYVIRNMEPNSLEISSPFTALREMKNRIFFATLTNATIDMFR